MYPRVFSRTFTAHRSYQRVQKVICATSVQAQPERARRAANSPTSNFYVDSTCIDCDTCRWMAPSTFIKASDGMTAVQTDPQTKAERLAALQALVSCPTFSIHVGHKEAGELKEALEGFPLPIPGTAQVFHLGYHDRASYAATPYLILRPAGNIMVDCSRFNPQTLAALKKLGGVKYLFLTHQDDVGDHAKWAEALGCQRIIHESDVRRTTQGVEVKLHGSGPWKLQDGGEDVEILHTPGHTAGSCSLLYRPDRALFSGDHLAYSARRGGLTMFLDYNWHSVRKQIDSSRSLLGLDFLHLLPGHGRRTAFQSVSDKDAALMRLLEYEAAPAGGKKSWDDDY